MSPFKARHPCSYPGCSMLTQSRFCSKHDSLGQRRYDEDRGTAATRGYDTRWHKLRDMKLARDPLCEEDLKKGNVIEASMVHHIIPIEDGGEVLGWDNLMSLCHSCHAKKHEMINESKRMQACGSK